MTSIHCWHCPVFLFKRYHLAWSGLIIGKHSLKVNNANFAPAKCQLCNNVRCASFSYHQLIFNSKTRKRAKLALCKTMPIVIMVMHASYRRLHNWHCQSIVGWVKMENANCAVLLMGFRRLQNWHWQSIVGWVKMSNANCAVLLMGSRRLHIWHYLSSLSTLVSKW